MDATFKVGERVRVKESGCVGDVASTDEYGNIEVTIEFTETRSYLMQPAELEHVAPAAQEASDGK